MRLSDVVSGAGLAFYAQVALVLFLIAFLVIALRLWLGRDRAEHERMSRMPLADDERPTPQTGAKP